MASQVLHKRNRVWKFVPKPFSITVDSRLRGLNARQQTDPRRIAQWSGAIGFRKGDAPFRQSIDIGGLADLVAVAANQLAEDYDFSASTGSRAVLFNTSSSLVGIWGTGADNFYVTGFLDEVVFRCNHDPIAGTFSYEAIELLFPEKALAKSSRQPDVDHIGRPRTPWHAHSGDRDRPPLVVPN